MNDFSSKGGYMRNRLMSILRTSGLNFFAALAVSLTPFYVLAAAIQSQNVIGEILLAVGVSKIEREKQIIEPVKRGDKLLAGDGIRTEAGAHVHIRFVDGALVSVRPFSHLVISAYQFDPLDLANSTVRFDLAEGTARSITGRAGEAARGRFRLNTPVAAIGVRGTDFVVGTDREVSSVTVQDGAVAVASLGLRCTVAELGPCDNSLKLDASQRALFARISPTGTELLPIAQMPPRGVPLKDEDRLKAATVSNATKSARPVAAPLGQPGVLFAGDVVLLPSLDAALPGPKQDTMLDFRQDERARVYAERIGQLPAASTELPPSVMAWGRWAPQQLPNDTQDPAPVIHRLDYSRVVVSDGVFALLTDTANRQPMPREGQFAFSLRDARVSLLTANGPTPGKVLQGALSIDFAMGRFETFLKSSHPDVDGVIWIAGAGALQSDGLFRANTILERDPLIVGVVVNDAKEAAYVFSRGVTTRSSTLLPFIGTTRWGR